MSTKPPSYPPNRTVQYAVVTVMGQTIGFVSAGNGVLTTEHPKARLWDNVADASIEACELSVRQALFLKNGGPEPHPVSYTDDLIVERFGYWVESVWDETEFRARKDTW